MNNKKTILHFTLAVGLIIGICITAKLRPASAEKLNHLSNMNQNVSTKEDLPLIKDILDKDQISINDIKEDEDILSNDDVSTKRTIDDIRYNFDVSSADQVKEVQRILGLKEDGIFGPKTKRAYQEAIFGQGFKNSYAKDISKNKDESPLSTSNAMLD
tara:strand:+ start:200 stop:673 length:474 start_codon:yes stop_codon:yes gene_type:complete